MAIFSRASRPRIIDLARWGLIGLVVASASALAAAQGDYPSKPLRLVVPQAAGGTGDTVSRIVAQKLSARLGQPVIVENRPGAGGTVGSSLVAKAPADGYSLVLASTGYATWATMYPNIPFNPAADLAPVAMMGSLPFAVLVRSESQYRTIADLVAFARANPGKATYASAGAGALSHLLAAWFGAEAGIDVRHIPYNGTAPALNALLGEQVDFYFDPVATSIQLVKSGRLRALATTGAERSEVLPEVPTFVESGFPIRGSVWLGLMTTGGTPAPLIDHLNREIHSILQDPDTRAQLKSRGVEVEAMSQQQFGAFLASEVRTWSKLVRDNGIKPE
jgi:tripartite-type tricarboxylate transporter receptor subunit TctC